MDSISEISYISFYNKHAKKVVYTHPTLMEPEAVLDD